MSPIARTRVETGCPTGGCCTGPASLDEIRSFYPLYPPGLPSACYSGRTVSEPRAQRFRQRERAMKQRDSSDVALFC